MQAEDISKQMKALKSKSKAARKAGSRKVAAGFLAGSKRLQRRLARLNKSIPKVKKAES